MGINRIERIDAENVQFFKEQIDDVEVGKLSVKDILGFNIDKSTVFIPEFCPFLVMRKSDSSAIFSLVPMYNTVIYPVYSSIEGIIVNESNFQTINGMPLKDFLVFIEKGHIIPYFHTKYSNYDENLIRNFLEPGMPRISIQHMHLVRWLNSKNFENNIQKLGVAKDVATAQKDLSNLLKQPEDSLISCAECLVAAYAMGIEKSKILGSTNTRRLLCGFMDIVASRNLNAVFKTSCKETEEALGLFACNDDFPEPVDAIVKGLKVKYSPELDLESYLNLLDGKTTRAIRQITSNIMEDPFSIKYSEHLSSKIFEYNQEIEEVGRSRAARFYQAVSDIAVYGGNEYVSRQTNALVKANKNNLNRASELIASKLIDIHAKVTGKDWTIAQLYKTRCNIERCKKPVPQQKKD